MTFGIAPRPHFGGAFVDPRRRTLGVVLRLRSPVGRQRVRSGLFDQNGRELELELGSWSCQLGGLFRSKVPVEDLANPQEGIGIMDLRRQRLL